ncbi:replication protein RepA [Brachybacterium tyrofermentans]|uniref:replication protein RepA n=1 Tax=Brachybacterium tyrofermentans TaxID=47848 RepID=UPI003FD4E06D
MNELERMISPQLLAGDEKAVVTEDQEVGYTTRLLLQTLFPYQKQESDKVVRQSGPLKVTAISANGLPYGKYPRLIAVYLITEAVKRKDLPEDEARRIPLGASMQRFLSDVGITSRASGGRTGSIRTMREQLRRLAATTITVERLYDAGTERSTLRNLGLFDSMDFWVTPDPNQLALTEPYLELTIPFFHEVTENPIPVDVTILRALGKARAIDVYLWATFKKYGIRTPFTLSWEQAQSQFGPEMATTARGRADFKKEMVKTVERVAQQWPTAGLTAGPDGLELTPGQPSIPRRAARTKPKRTLR